MARYFRSRIIDKNSPNLSYDFYYAYRGDDPSEKPIAAANIEFTPDKTTLTHESGMVDEEYPVITQRSMRPARENEQLQLFHHTPEHGHTVEGLYSLDNPSAKISAMTLVGLADLHSRAQTGKPVQPSSNLSEHSLRIVRHLEDAGALGHVDELNLARPSNDLSFDYASGILSNKASLGQWANRNEITPQARGARKHILRQLRPPKRSPHPWRDGQGPASSSQNDQLKLFEE